MTAAKTPMEGEQNGQPVKATGGGGEVERGRGRKWAGYFVTVVSEENPAWAGHFVTVVSEEHLRVQLRSVFCSRFPPT